MSQVESSVRQVRALHVALLISILLYALIGEKAGPAKARDVKQLKQVFIPMAVLALGVAVVFRQRMVRPAEELLRTATLDSQAGVETSSQGPLGPLEQTRALAQWRAGNVVAFVLCETVALIGLVLRMLGGTLFESAPFYAAAVLLMLVWTPRPNLSGGSLGPS